MQNNLADARRGKQNGVIRFTRAQIDARAKERRKLNGKAAAYSAKPSVRKARNAAQQSYRAANPDKVSKFYRNWEESKGPLGLLLFRARRGAAKRGLEFAIGASDFSELPTHCPILGLELDYVGTPGRNPRASAKASRASIDRKDNARGYVPGNVFIVSFRANQLKSDGTPSELRALANWMEK